MLTGGDVGRTHHIKVKTLHGPLNWLFQTCYHDTIAYHWLRLCREISLTAHRTLSFSREFSFIQQSVCAADAWRMRVKQTLSSSTCSFFWAIFGIGPLSNIFDHHGCWLVHYSLMEMQLNHARMWIWAMACMDQISSLHHDWFVFDFYPVPALIT